MKDKIFDYLKSNKILILGYGREGKATYNFIRSYSKDIKIGIADINNVEIDDTNVTLHIGDNYLNSIKDYDIVIKAPGVIIKDYISEEDKKKITSETDLFLKFCNNKVIGITGTKGKSTTSSLIYHILKECKYNTILVGNIGIPCFEKFDEINEKTIIVYELSCHQLEYVTSSPNIGVILNIYEEHLDHYNDIYKYVKSKENIYKYQTSNDYFIYCSPINYISDNIKNIKSNVIEITNTKEKYYINNKNKIEEISKNDIETSLIGNHNISNIVVCMAICNLLNIDKKLVLNAIKTFTSLEHRLEYVGTYNDIKYYNDSISTAVESTINAVIALAIVDTIIIGGMDRGLHYDNLVTFLNKSNVSNIMLLPNTNKRISKLFDELNSNKKIYIVNNMTEAVKISKQVTKKDMICLLSPAAASYGFYKNFIERGNHFKELVKDNK